MLRAALSLPRAAFPTSEGSTISAKSGSHRRKNFSIAVTAAAAARAAAIQLPYESAANTASAVAFAPAAVG